MSFRALCTLDFGCICAVATETRNAWLVKLGNKPGFSDILWKAMSMNKMWQLLLSILNIHTSTEALVLEIGKINQNHQAFLYSFTPSLGLWKRSGLLTF